MQLQGVRALAAERRRVEGERRLRSEGDVTGAGEEGVAPFSVMRGQATGARRAAARRQRAAKAALMAQPRTNTYLQRKQRANVARPAPEPEPEHQVPPHVSVTLWRAQTNSSMGVAPTHTNYSEAQVQLDRFLADDSRAGVGDTSVADPAGSALLEPVEPNAERESPGSVSEGEAPAPNTRDDDRDALDSPLVSVEHSSTSIAVAELRRQHVAFHGASIGAADTLTMGNNDSELSCVDLDLATAQSRRGGGLSSTQGLHTSQALQELRRARDPKLADSVVLNDDASPWRVLQPGARQTDTVQSAMETTMLPNDLRDMVSVLAAEEVHRCVSVEAETVKAALQEDLKRAEEELSAQRDRELQMKQRVVEAAENAVADEQIRHAEATRALIAEHTQQIAQFRREREEAQSRCSGLEAQVADSQVGLLAAQAEAQALSTRLLDAVEHAATAASAAAAEVGSLQLKLLQSETAVASLKRENRELEASLAAERTARHETKTDATKRLADMDEQLKTLRQELMRQQRLTQASDEAKAAANCELAQHVSATAVDDAGRAEVQAKVNALQQEVENCKHQIQTLTAELESERARKKVAKTQQVAAVRAAARATVGTSDAEEVTPRTRISDWLDAAQRSASQLAQDLAADDDQGHSQRSLLAATMLLKNMTTFTPMATRMPDRPNESAAEKDGNATSMRAELRQEGPSALRRNRRKRLSQMKRSVSVDFCATQTSDEMFSSSSSVASRLPSPTSSPSATRARQRAETHSMQEVQSLRKRNAELQMELRVAKQKLDEHSCSNVDDNAASMTVAVEKVRAEVNATAEEQERVMDKLRWIKQTLLDQGYADSTRGEATVSPRAHAGAENADGQGPLSLEILTIDLENNPAHLQTTDGPTRDLEDTEFSPRTEQAIVESLQSSIGVTAPR